MLHGHSPHLPIPEIPEHVGMPPSDPPLLSSPSCSASPSTDSTTKINDNGTSVFDIPVEIVTEEEMAFIESALSAAASASRLAPRSWAPLSSCWSHGTSPRSNARLVPRTPPRDIEDSAGAVPRRSLFLDFRFRRGLTVTDLTATEWCEKQMEFSLKHGKPRRTEAMIAGSNRHVQLEEEVVEKVQIQTKSIEDTWAVNFLNFIVGMNQLLFEGMTRELPVIGVVEGLWLKGVIDEVRMPRNGTLLNPILVDTKTRRKVTLPSEAQKRNARLQLMCYKYLWDNLTLNSFPKEHFFKYYHLNPNCILSEDVNKYISSLGFCAKTLEDVLTYFCNACCSMSPAHKQLLLRYELQSDSSLLEEYEFEYDEDWFRTQIKECFKFWLGERDAYYVSEDENWKCRFCSFTERCPMTATSNMRAS